MTTLYKILGVRKRATAEQIKTAYREKVKQFHPDKGGDAEKFREIQEAFEVLGDKERRKRYDSTGRTDPPVITPEKIRFVIRETMKNIVEFVDKSTGYPDDPTRVDVLANMVNSLLAHRANFQDQSNKAQRKLERTNRLLERFKPKKGKEDYIGDALRLEKNRLQEE